MFSLTNLDQFFFYFFIPSLIILSAFSSRLYYSRKKTQSKISRISHGILIGNLLISIIGISLILFLYSYILGYHIIQDIRWELLTIFSITFLTMPLGIGIGAHIAGATFEQLLRPELHKTKNNHLSQTIHYFHAIFGHRIPMVTALLIFYLLTLLDLLKGTTTIQNMLQISLVITAGSMFGAILIIIAIITRCQKISSHISLIVLTSILIVSTNETISITAHPVALLFTTTYIVIIMGYFINKQTKFNLNPYIKKFVKSWIKWDGIIIDHDHLKFRKTKQADSKTHKSL